ncbi:MAG: DUF5615 family PIN-like protein [Phycisphaerales bacterium]
MRLLIDNSLSWRVARDLREAGHDAVHVESVGLARASDATIYQFGSREGRVIVTQDADFGAIHAACGQSTGVVLMRQRDGRPSTQAEVLTAALAGIEPSLARHAYAIIADDGIWLFDSTA